MPLKYFAKATFLLLLFASCESKQENYPFRNPDLPIEERIDDLLSRLTPEEKVGQMMNQTPAVERLGIPEYDWWNEALHGVARAGRSTVFPQSIAMASTFDDEALYKTFCMVSDEARAKYHRYQKNKEYDRYKGLTFWTPNINIFRDPRWGRGMETYGEDPYLTSRLGLAVIKGLQGDNPKYLKTHACAKHYAVHSGPERKRHQFNVEPTPRDLWQTYLPAFETAVKEGKVQEVMCAYNRFEGKPCCSSDRLLIDILRNSWGYKNIIVTDCGAIGDFYGKGAHETHPDGESASADAVLSGTDLECGDHYKKLINVIQKGLITEKDLDVSLRRLLKGRFELGMFDPDERVPYSQIPYSVVESPEHVQMALEMARKSMVLLKNKDNILPLSKSVQKVAVVGPNAVDSIMQWGNYNGFPSHTETILEGIRKKIPDAEIIYEQGCNHNDDFVVYDLGNYMVTPEGKGFLSEFFNNTEFEGEPVYEGLVDQLHYTTGGDTQFAPRVNPTNFSARFNSVFECPLTDDVVFRVSANEAFRLYIGGEKVAEQWESEYGGERTYTLKAEKGKKYPIQIEYMQRLGSADLNFQIGTRRPVDYVATVSKVKEADVIIYVGGISPRMEDEGRDRSDIELPEVQQKMIKALKATGKPVVYVLCTGSALALNWEEANVDAILNAWYGGQEGGTAVGDILFGDYNPSGRLPITFYKSVKQLPDLEDYHMEGHTYRYMKDTPLYPFGYGLSYTSFAYQNAKLSSDKILKGQSVTLSLEVANTGKRDGDEIVQVYIKNPNDPKGPIKTLKAFARLSVKAENTQKVNIELTPEAFYSFNDNTQDFEIRSGKYQILYGGSSADKDLHAITVEIN